MKLSRYLQSTVVVSIYAYSKFPPRALINWMNCWVVRSAAAAAAAAAAAVAVGSLPPSPAATQNFNHLVPTFIL